MPSRSLNLPGQSVAGRYTVLGSIGEGGMSVVLAAYDARLDRRVALKLMHPHLRAQEAEGEQLQARLLREAQAMARLNHPHVVAVYDTGQLEDGSLYLAMEYVEGETLGAWCRARKRTWREVLARYVAAARGLAAAHAAGLVHRDFKPENVMVGKDGRVRVMDFGLARGQLAVSRPALAAPPMSQEEVSSSLTLAGTVVGTPRYMAPEVLLGHPADARSDIFAFCVALYEALYGQPAFPESELSSRLTTLLESKPRLPENRADVPAWLGRAVLRGLNADPRQRPATMQQLIAALEDDPEERWRSRRRAATLVVSGMALMALVFGGWLRWREPRCAGREQLDGVWDESIRAQVRGMALKSGLSYAPAAARQLERKLDEYADEWLTLSQRVCEAEPRRDSAHDAPGLRRACLERRRGRLRALTELLAREGDRSMETAPLQVAALPPLGDCMDERALTAASPLPEDPAARETVRALLLEVDRLEALFEAGRYKEGAALGEQLLPRVSQVAFPPLEAQTLANMAWLQWGLGDRPGAEARARRSLLLAAGAQERALQARDWALLMRIVREKGDAQKALDLELALSVAVEAAGDDTLRAVAANELGNAFRDARNYPRALEQHKRAVELFEKNLGREHPRTVGALNDLANVEWTLGRYSEALSMYERVEAVWEATLGPDHPYTAGSLTNLGSLLHLVGRDTEALAACQRAVLVFEKALGPEHPNVAIGLSNLGIVLGALDRSAEAQDAFKRALRIFEKAEPSNSAALSTVLGELGAVLRAHGEPAKAVPVLERALALSHGSSPFIQFQLARALVESGGDMRRARELAERARDSWQRLDHPRLAEVSAWLEAHPASARAQ